MFSGKHCFNEFLKDPPVQPDFAPVTLLKSLIHLMGGFDENIHRSISMTALLVISSSMTRRRKDAC